MIEQHYGELSIDDALHTAHCVALFPLNQLSITICPVGISVESFSEQLN